MQAAELVKDYFSAWNRHDPTGIVGLLADNGFNFDVPLNEKLSGEPLADYLANGFTQEKLRYELVGEILIGNYSVAFQYRTCNADDSSDTAVGLCGAEFLTIHGNKVTGIEDYYEVSSSSKPRSLSVTGEPTILQSKYRKSGLRKEEAETYKQRLQLLMNQERLYLVADLTLPELASKMNCSVNHLSQVINGEFNLSFYEFLNQYRIEHAKELLTRRGGRPCSVSEVVARVGFRSDSAFYAAFNRFCHHTPTAYQLLHRKDPA